MANQTVKGIRWWQGGVSSKGPPIVYKPVASNYGSAIYVGMPVRLLDTGYVEISPGTEGTAGLIYGVVATIGRYYDATRGRMIDSEAASPKYLPANTVYGTNIERESRLGIIPVAGQRFVLDGNAALTTATRAGALALVGSAADHTIASDDVTLNVADLESKDAAPASAQWQVEDFVEAPNTDFTAARIKFVCKCIEPQFPDASVTPL